MRRKKTMVKMAILEDEDASAKRLTDAIVQYCDGHEIKFTIDRFENANEMLDNYRPIYDIIFMDIILPSINGIDSAKELRKMDDAVTIIFVTDMANLAVKGYEVNALDFIVKPVEYSTFSRKFERALNVVRHRKSIDVCIQIDRTLKRISASKIYYIEIIHHKLIFHTEEGNFNSRGTLDGLEKQLAPENFVRCNACYLVNMKFVSEVSGDDVVVAGEALKISRTKKKAFMQALTNYLGKMV